MSLSMMITGVPRCIAAATGPTSAWASSGASTIASVPALMWFSTTEICPRRSSSVGGPCQTISTPNSREALTAPACTVFQNE